MSLTSAERTDLSTNAKRRTGRNYLLAQAIFPGASAIIVLVLTLANLGNHHQTAAHRWIALALAAAFIVVVCGVAWFMHRYVQRNASLVQGADRDTRRSVRKALRDGSSTSPKVDDLVADLRTHWAQRRVSRSLSFGLLCAFTVLFLVNSHDRATGIIYGVLVLILAASTARRGWQLKRYHSGG